MVNKLNDYMPLILAFSLGSLVGAGVMALLAPKTGEETRSLIAQKGQTLRENAAKKVEDTTDRTGRLVEDISQRARETAVSVFHRGQVTAESFKSNVEQEAKSKSVQFGR